jgi:hypothetical protein
MDRNIDEMLKKGRFAAPHNELLNGLNRKLHQRRIRRTVSGVLGTGVLALFLAFGLFRTAPSVQYEAATRVNASEFFTQDTDLFCLPGYESTVSMLFDEDANDTDSSLINIQDNEPYPVNL